MQVFSKHPATRWLVPFVVVLVVASGTLLGGRAVADPGLPALSAQDLLTKVATAKPAGFSGTVEQTADLGLPSIGQSSNGSDFADLLSGTHTLHVAYAAPDAKGAGGGARVAVNGQFGESDLITDGQDVWLWSSEKNEVVHRSVTGPKGGAGKAADLPADAPKTPADAVERALAAITPTTDVSVATTTTVAGRSAYQLILTPKDADTLVSSVRIAVDGDTYAPLRLEVFADGTDDPAFSTGFTDVDFTVPPASEFTFTPPKGAKVTEAKGDRADGTGSGAAKSGAAKKAHDKADRARAGAAAPTVVGDGWAQVVVADAGSSAVKGLSDQGQAAQALQALPKVSGTWGSGRLLSGTLFSAVLTDDGRVAVGAVRPEALYRALG